MPVAIITGSGTHALPGFAGETTVERTRFGDVEISEGTFAGVDVLHLSRHGAGHERLSHQVTHRANITALAQRGATAVIGCTVCGAVDPALELGSLVVFDDLHFPSNRLPDGSQCTVFTEPGDPNRGHWILHGGPFADGVRAPLLAAAGAAGHPARDGGAYGYVDGPRFNTPAEIAQLAVCGVVAVSQTAGPETVLCGELELPYGLIGFITDYANEVIPGEPTPVSTLAKLMRSSTGVLADVLAIAVPALDGQTPAPGGTMFRIAQG